MYSFDIFIFLAEDLIFESNKFLKNVASQNGFAVYITGSLKTVNFQYNVFSNNSMANEKQIEGSVIFLENPGNISIVNCLFETNFGISGTCLTYSEISKFIFFIKLIQINRLVNVKFVFL